MDARGFTIHSLAKRIDLRSTEELEKELLAPREVTLDDDRHQQMSAAVADFARKQKEAHRTFSSSVVAAFGRPDLAGLPFRFGPDTVLGRDKAQAMNGLSQQLRDTIQSCVKSTTDPRPDTDDLYATLIGGTKGNFARNRNRGQWATAEAVPCILQMLQAENREVRRMSCELLRTLDVPEATEALVRWAVFDTDAGNRAAAVDALRGRNPADVARLLVRFVRYPLPRAAEHACEALVALNCLQAVPQLAAHYDQPDPDAAARVDLPGNAGGTYRYEVVRVNHARNCVLCHAPAEKGDLIQGAIPDPQKELPPPRTYYHTHGKSVTAETTYLRQDFSVVQRVPNSGKWPAHQRYDYFVAVRKENGPPPKAAAAGGPYREAVRFAIRELTGRDPDKEADWLAEQRAAAPPDDARLGDAAKYATLLTKPDALAALGTAEYGGSPLSLPDKELGEAVGRMQKAYGTAASRLALIAYLEPLTRTGAPAAQAKAARLVATARTGTGDLPATMKAAAKEPADPPKQ